MLIDETGEKLGQFVTRDALELAKERSLDLIEVAPNARPPVCRIGDWGRIKFERQKNETEARRKQRETRTQVKEIKVRPKTDGHDLDFKTKKVRQFLTDGDKVKITVRFRGREHAHHDLGAEQCYAVYEEVKDICKVEAPPRMDGRQMFMLLAPN
ncbi:MAG: translation initiation factor IF-3 [Cognaticolwellia sp.]